MIGRQLPSIPNMVAPKLTRFCSRIGALVARLAEVSLRRRIIGIRNLSLDICCVGFALGSSELTVLNQTNAFAR